MSVKIPGLMTLVNDRRYPGNSTIDIQHGPLPNGTVSDKVSEPESGLTLKYGHLARILAGRVDVPVPGAKAQRVGSCL